jgi:hypothetical protein
MTTDPDRLFRPRLESLEDRALLTVWPGYRFLVPPNLVGRTATVISPHIPRGTHTPAEIHTIFNPGSVFTRSVTIVPHHISLGLYDTPNPITVRGFDPGLSVPGLRTPPVLVSDAGFSMPGLPQFAPSQPVTPPPFQVGGLTVSPDGTISGSFP